MTIAFPPLKVYVLSKEINEKYCIFLFHLGSMLELEKKNLRFKWVFLEFNETAAQPVQNKIQQNISVNCSSLPWLLKGNLDSNGMFSLMSFLRTLGGR